MADIVGNFKCECPEPYFGAQVAGTPLRCERCRGLVEKVKEKLEEAGEAIGNVIGQSKFGE